MTIGSILLGIALLLVVVLYVARPFLFPASRRAEGDRLNRREALEAQKEAIMLQIRELDFDQETGKLPEEEYQTLRQQYLAEAAHILKALDALRPATEQAGDIEAAIARLRNKPAAAKVAPVADDIEAAVARRRQQAATANGQATATSAPARSAAGKMPAKRAGFCSQCGEARDGDDKFCAYCGHAFA